MSTIAIILAGIFAVGVLIGIYAWLAPRAPAKPAALAEEQQEVSAPDLPQASPSPGDWTAQAGEEFAGLTESARCDLIFAVAHLDDERSHHLLVHAMDDPSDAVATAAAHALAQRGAAREVQHYAEQHPGERAERILETVALLQ